MESFSCKKTFDDIRNYLAGRFLGATRDEFLLEEIVKLIFCKYKMEGIDTNNLNELALSSLYRKRFKEVLSIHPDIYSDDSIEIELDPISIKYIDDKFNMIDFTNLSRDIIGDAYEIFIGDAIKGQSGQFFTPQNAAVALTRMVNPSSKSKILDLTCGAGGFLVAAKKHDPLCRSNLYGVDKDNYLVRLAKIHLACLGCETTSIQCADSLVWDTAVLGDDQNAYDVILTNPPFGVNIQAGTIDTLSKFDLAYKRRKNGEQYIKTSAVNESIPPQVVFLEQCIRLLKEDGTLGIVLPESMISNKKYIYVIEYILTNCLIKAVIGMPDELFKTSGKGGTHTKTCLLVLQKKTKSSSNEYNIFMSEAKWCGHDSRGREIPNDDIPEIVDNYLRFSQTGEVPNNSNGFLVSVSSLVNSVLAPRAYLSVINDNNHDFSSSHILISIQQLINEGILDIRTGNEVGKLAYGTGTIPFIRTSDISNWEIKSDPKHSVSNDLYLSLKQKQDVQAGDILMVKDGSYLIGTCAMVTKYDTKMLYQSHLYKIRVKKQNPYGLDEYFLLALLSSDYLKQQIQTNTFSHDIINSLGDRLKDLILPIPKDAEKIKRISKMVQKSIKGSIEARELAKEARSEVLI